MLEPETAPSPATTALTSSASSSSSSAPAAAPDELERALRELFGHAAFRDGQREIVEAVLAGQDVLAVLPTGAGKSLLYQLPAFLLPGVTIAVSPLIALMKDQLDKLQRTAARCRSPGGLAAAVLNSGLSSEEQDRVLERVARGETKLLLVAPERFKSPRFRAALARVRISLFAVDEAHCVSEWGHDFRPDYDRLGEAARVVGRPPILAVTATATEKVRRDIARSLELAADHRVFIRGFDRPNLRFSVVHASGEAEKARAVAHAIAECAGRGPGSVIAYCATRKSCERLATRLKGEGVRALVYHAGLPPLERRTVQERWQASEVSVVVATNAFGLGIDKEDVRLVVHHDLPGSLEAYYQEAGRAGRDGRESECVLVFSPADVHLQNYMADGSFPERACVESVARALASAKGFVDAESIRGRTGSTDWSERAIATALALLEGAGLARSDRGGEGYAPASADLARGDLPGVDWDRLERLREHEREKLARVLAYARAATCRRATILRYFGAATSQPAGCGACDRCLAPAEDRLPADEALTVVRKVLSLVARLRGRFGRGTVARLLAGEVEPDDRTRGIADLPTIGALRPWSVDACGAAVDSCLAHELVETVTEDGKYPKLRLTAPGVEVLLGRVVVDVAIPSPDAARRAKGSRAKTRGSSNGARSSVRASSKEARPEARASSKEARPEARASTKGAASLVADPGPALDPAAEQRLAALKKWRSERARDEGVPAYCVFHDRTLAALAAAQPADLAALLEVPGLGAKKAERYGEALLGLLRPQG